MSVIPVLKEKGVFPEKLKTSIITPIPKIKKSNNASDFRPINTLLPIEKVLVTNTHKTALQLSITIYDMIDRNKYIVQVFIDLRRAFETIDQYIKTQIKVLFLNSQY